MRARISLFILFLITLTAANAFAQTSVAVAGGYSEMWDDETFLGRGPAVSGGIAQGIGRHLSLEGEVAASSHHRDAGYLAADGTPIIGTARLAYLFRDGDD